MRAWLCKIGLFALMAGAAGVYAPALADAASNLSATYVPFDAPYVTGTVYTNDAQGISFHVYNSANAELTGYAFKQNVQPAASGYRVDFSARGVYNGLGMKDPLRVQVADSDGTGAVSEVVYGAGELTATVLDGQTQQPVSGVSWLLYPAGTLTQGMLDDPDVLPTLLDKYRPLRAEGASNVPLGTFDVVADALTYKPLLAGSAVTISHGQPADLGTLHVQPNQLPVPSVVSTVYNVYGQPLTSDYALSAAGGPFGSLTIRRYGMQNLVGPDATATYVLKVNTGGYKPHFVLGSGNIAGWDWDAATKLLSIRVQPAAYMDQNGSSSTLVLLGVKYFDPLADHAAGTGGFFATNGYSWSRPVMDANHNLKMQVTGNHNVPSPFFNAYFPASQVAEWGLKDPSQLGVDFSSDSGDNSGVSSTVTADTYGGYMLKMSIHFSTNSFLMGNASTFFSEAGTVTPGKDPAPPAANPGPGGQSPGGNGGGGGGGGGSRQNAELKEGGVLQLDAGHAAAEQSADGSTLLAYTIDAGQLQGAFQAAAGTTAGVVIDTGTSGSVKVALPADALADQTKANTNATITVKSGLLSYELPLRVLDLGRIAAELGADLQQTKVTIVMEKVPAERLRSYSDKVRAVGGKPLGDTIDFQINVEAGGKTYAVDSFGSAYVSRTIAVEGVGDSSYMSGVMVDPGSGEFMFVPTFFAKVGGKTQATIKRNGNSVYGIVELHRSFADVAAHWANPTIDKLASKLIVSGVTDDSFRPDAGITRAQFATLLVKGLGIEPFSASAVFSDVSPDSGFSGYIGAAAQAGLVSGFEDGTFQPDAFITREQLAVMLMRAMRYASAAASAAVPAAAASPTQPLLAFADSGQISAWAEQAAAEAVRDGFIQGLDAATFAPQRTASRAEAAVMLERLLQKLQFIN